MLRFLGSVGRNQQTLHRGVSTSRIGVASLKVNHAQFVPAAHFCQAVAGSPITSPSTAGTAPVKTSIQSKVAKEKKQTDPAPGRKQRKKGAGPAVSTASAFTMAPAAPLLSEEELVRTRDKIRRGLAVAHSRGDHSRQVKLLYQARELCLALDTREYANGLTACVYLPKALGCKTAFWIFDLLKERGVLPVEVFVNMLKICRHADDVQKAEAILHDFKARYGALTEQMFSEVLLLLTRDVKSARVALAEQYYTEFRAAEQQRGWKASMKVYIAMARMYIRMGVGEAALRVLREMTAEAQYEPTAYVCNDLLEPALFAGQAMVLRVLAHWNADSFQVRLDRGVLGQMLQVGAAAGDQELAQLAFKLLRANEYLPAALDYECLARAALMEGDVITAVEVLQEMELVGLGWGAAVDVVAADQAQVDARSGGEAAATMNVSGVVTTRQRMQQRLVGALCSEASRKMDMLDKLYYALLDQMRGGGEGGTDGVVPRIVLDAIVESAGRQEKLDRSFATFQEYSALFGISPDIGSYNALLRSCSAGQTVNMHTLLSVFQDIESNGFVPNSESFGLLLEGMCSAQDFRVLEDVLGHCTAPVAGAAGTAARDKVLLPPRALRRVAVALAKQGDWEAVDRVLAHLDRQQAGRQNQGLWTLRESEQEGEEERSVCTDGSNGSSTGTSSRREVGQQGGIPTFLVYRLERIRKRQHSQQQRYEKN